MARAVDRSERREQVARAALPLFVRNGRESVTIQQIAEAAGLSFWQVYHRFGGTDQLHRIVVSTLLAELEGRIDAVRPESASVAQAVTCYVSSLSAIIGSAEYRDLLYLVVRDSQSIPELRDEYDRRVAGAIRRGIERTVGAGRGGDGLAVRKQALQDSVAALEAAFALPNLVPSFAWAKSGDRSAAISRIANEIISSIYVSDWGADAA